MAGCGGQDRSRALEIELEGLSARAEILVLKIFPGTNVTCVTLNMENVSTTDAPIEAQWVRSDGTDRNFSLPSIEEEAITIAAYSQNAQGRSIQFVCQQLEFTDVANLPLGLLRLVLSARVPT
jgi:hypothetical protein